MATLCLQLPEPNKAKNLAVSVRTVSSLTVTWDAGEGENTGFTVQLGSGKEVPATNGKNSYYVAHKTILVIYMRSLSIILILPLVY